MLFERKILQNIKVLLICSKSIHEASLCARHCALQKIHNLMER